MSNYKAWTDRDLAEEVDERAENLTPWEIEFVDNVVSYIKKVHRNKRNPLSAAQRDKLEQIAQEKMAR